jgi:iron(III) transport system substrate-binding protein
MTWTAIARSVFSVVLLAGGIAGCQKNSQQEVVVYCAVDEPYAGPIFRDFEKETGIHVDALYDIESSKSVGLAGKLEAERAHPQADVWWGSEAFLTARLAGEQVLAPYASPAAADIPAEYKDKNGLWTGVGLRARVLAIGTPAPSFPITSLQDLLDPRLKNQIAMSRPTAGATGANIVALCLFWGQPKADAFFTALHNNGVNLLGGNAEVADQVGGRSFVLGLTDSDDVANAQANGGKLTLVVPDQGPDQQGTVTMPSTVGFVTGSRHPAAAKKLIDYLVSRQTEDKLMKMHYSKWSVRDPANAGGIKSIPVDYDKAAQAYAITVRRATALLEGRPMD